MVSFGELNTKGENKRDFIRCLSNDLRIRFVDLNVKIRQVHDKIYLDLLSDNQEEVLTILSHVPGISKYCVIESTTINLDEIIAKTISLFDSVTGSFKIDVKRADKRFEMTSQELEKLLGAKVVEVYNLKVKLKNPDHTLYIEIRQQGVYYYFKFIKGLGGFPLCSIGKGLLMLSGGIDSPVAGYLSIKRGIKISCIHFASPPYTSEGVIMKIKQLIQVLNTYQPSIRLYVVPFTKIQEAIYLNDNRYHVTTMRRMMYTIANIIAKRHKLLSIITGESIGQVASQTLESLNCISQGQSLITLRPCSVMDKTSIIEIAQAIKTFDISNQPFTDCCTIFPVTNPVTKPKLDIAKKIEELVDYSPLISQAIKETKVQIINAKTDIYSDD
jgi:thiamine biosynthesis protein ThiI